MSIATFTKDPADTLDYQIDWSDFVALLTISTSSWVVPSGITDVTDSHTSTAAIIRLSGGTAGTDYECVNQVTLSNGQISERSIKIRVREVELSTNQWSYDVTKLDVGLNAVRYLVRDTDSADPIVLDAEINFALSQNGNSLYRSAADVCDAIALELGRQLTFTGPISESAKEKFEQYKQMAAQYRLKASMKAGAIFAGGISVADKNSRNQDADRAPNDFDRNTGRTPGTSFDPSETWRDWP